MQRQRKIAKLKNGVVGVISDTHGLVRPEALAALRGVDLIIHAGDIGKAEVLDSLARVAPVFAIRGNNDAGPWAEALPDVLELKIASTKLHVIHNLQELPQAPFVRGTQLVISGHSHKPVHRVAEGIHYLNPGSAGPRRFKLPIALARVSIGAALVAAEIIELSA
ncbi:MAG: metallophosphoesterase family protein [Deltaproteobacteria bacterium]|nr:metallophosphoesterase family protein [Deltaproteobacteria bacterium]